MRYQPLGVVLLAIVMVLGAVSLAPIRATATPPDQWHTFPTIAAGGELPSGQACAEQVVRSPWEPRLENGQANSTMPDTVELPGWSGFDLRANLWLMPRIDGRFTGTTEEILQWASCKWGIDTEVVRAMAWQESGWDQRAQGDRTWEAARCLPGYQPPCPVSFGILQIKYFYHPGTYPASLEHTAFNVDYSLGQLRACYEGWIPYLGGDYGPGDLWACVGHHFSGAWKDPGAEAYTARVLNLYAARPWTS
jgi:autotransporter family porin